MDRTLIPSILLLAVTFAVCEATGIDLRVQDHFYNFATRSWLVDAASPLPRLLFYTGPKALVWLTGLALLAAAILYGKFPLVNFPRRDLWIAVLTIATAPALIGLGKATTNTFTPAQIRRYGGIEPYVKVVQHYPENDHPPERGHGFPAGHASGGFALFALAGLASTRRGRAIGISLGIAFGTAMGAYQMFKGAHYLSHTLVTALLCWIVFLGWRRLVAQSLPGRSRSHPGVGRSLWRSASSGHGTEKAGV